MSLPRFIAGRRRAPALLSSLAFAFAVLAVLVAARASAAEQTVAPHMTMSNEDMERWVKEWYAKNPVRGLGTAAFPPAATFRVLSSSFDIDNSFATQVDTAKIFVGESVLWDWVSGTHTVTNGTGAADPQAGSLFDAASSGSDFTFKFNAAGTVRFFCRFHEFLNMRGVVVVSDPVIGAQVDVANFRFDADHDAGTQIDIVKIFAGQAVQWNVTEAGSHSVTNGTDSTDPAVGTLFDVVMGTGGVATFTQVFREPGDYPYFCRPHEFNEMKGIVRVLPADLIGTEPVPRTQIGFTMPPLPNPSSGIVRFRFAMPEDGPARATIIDARGARVALLFDKVLTAGEHPGLWDGHTHAGVMAKPGVYFLRLELPGHRSSERFVLAP